MATTVDAFTLPDGTVNLIVLPAAGGVTAGNFTRDETRRVIAALTAALED